MINKRGQGWDWGVIVPTIIVIGVILFISYLIWGFPSNLGSAPDQTPSIGEAVKDAKSFGDIFENPRAAILDNIFGKVPPFLINLTSDISAAIIIIGIWLLLVLTFGDILSVFGVFSPMIGWITGIVLGIIAANIKVVMYFAVVALIITYGLGALSVVLSIILTFGIFIAFNFGTQKLRQMLLNRKMTELRLRAATGSAKAKAGLETLAEIGQAAARKGKQREKI